MIAVFMKKPTKNMAMPHAETIAIPIQTAIRKLRVGKMRL